MWGGSWDHLAPFWKLHNLSSCKILHLWLNRDHPWGGRTWRWAVWAGEVCLPCSSMLLISPPGGFLRNYREFLLLLYLRRIVPLIWPELPAHLDSSPQADSPSFVGESSPASLFLLRAWAMGHQTWALACACPSSKKNCSTESVGLPFFYCTFFIIHFFCFSPKHNPWYLLWLELAIKRRIETSLSEIVLMHILLLENNAKADFIFERSIMTYDQLKDRLFFKVLSS